MREMLLSRKVVIVAKKKVHGTPMVRDRA